MDDRYYRIGGHVVQVTKIIPIKSRLPQNTIDIKTGIAGYYNIRYTVLSNGASYECGLNHFRRIALPVNAYYVNVYSMNGKIIYGKKYFDKDTCHAQCKQLIKRYPDYTRIYLLTVKIDHDRYYV